MKYARVVPALIYAVVNLNACGADDNGGRARRNTTTAPATLPTVAPTVSVGGSDLKPVNKVEDPVQGLLWNYSPLSAADTTALKCWLQDGPNSNKNQSVGQAVILGAALGLLISISGRSLLGQRNGGDAHATEAPTSPDQDFWLWQLYQANVKAPVRGALQGAGAGLICRSFILGISPINYPGLLGPQFNSAATAIFLGAMGAKAAHPLIKRLFGEPRSNSWKPISPAEANAEASRQNSLNKIYRAFHNSGSGKILRYKLAPGFTLLFVGGSVALLAYNDLEGVSVPGTPTYQECEQLKKNTGNLN